MGDDVQSHGQYDKKTSNFEDASRATTTYKEAATALNTLGDSIASEPAGLRRYSNDMTLRPSPVNAELLLACTPRHQSCQDNWVRLRSLSLGRFCPSEPWYIYNDTAGNIDRDVESVPFRTGIK